MRLAAVRSSPPSTSPRPGGERLTSTALQLDVDLGVDWRQDDPVTLDVGPVLSLGDAVGNKVSALLAEGRRATISTSTRSARRAGSVMSSW